MTASTRGADGTRRTAMMRRRRASMISPLSLLAWAATACAECAWVLWVRAAVADGNRRPNRASNRKAYTRTRRRATRARSRVPPVDAGEVNIDAGLGHLPGYVRHRRYRPGIALPHGAGGLGYRRARGAPRTPG